MSQRGPDAERWRRLESHPDQVVTALAVAAAGADHPRVVAGTGVGVRWSDDQGRTWAAGGPPLVVNALAPSLAFASDRTLFIGTPDGCFRVSGDGAAVTPVLRGGQVFALAVVPPIDAPEAGGTLFAGTAADGILRGDDGGRAWVSASAGLLDLTILALAFSATFAADRTGFAATASGLYRTRNGGRAWRVADLGDGEPAVQCLAIAPGGASAGPTYAGTEADGLWRSLDGGDTWAAVASLPARNITALAFTSGGGLVAATERGISRATDGGAAWVTTAPQLDAVLCLACLPGGQDGEDVLLAGTAGDGVVISRDAGLTWRPAAPATP